MEYTEVDLEGQTALVTGAGRGIGRAVAKALAAETQELGIRISAVLPGGVDTRLGAVARPDLDPKILLQPEDIARTVLFLLSLPQRAAIDQIYIRRSGSKPF